VSNLGQVCCSSSHVSHLISVCVCLFLSIPYPQTYGQTHLPPNSHPYNADPTEGVTNHQSYCANMGPTPINCILSTHRSILCTLHIIATPSHPLILVHRNNQLNQPIGTGTHIHHINNESTTPGIQPCRHPPSSAQSAPSISAGSSS